MKLSEAIEHFGSGAELARALGIHPQAVYQWGEDSIPHGRQCEIQILTKGKLKAAPKRTPVKR